MVGGWLGAEERLVTPGEGRTLSTLASDERHMNARFEETLCHFHTTVCKPTLPEAPAGGLKTTVHQWAQH